jgi:FMN phosphatase YigB (HAD superfamily)
MLKLKNTIPNHDKIKNIIFDFGGVICDLDISRTIERFKAFGPSKSDGTVSKEEQDRQFASLVELYEKGNITSQEFRETIKNHYVTPPSDQAVDDTWNALLVGIPEERIQLLNDLKIGYNVFLLSNSNEIHYLHYLEMFRQVSGYSYFQDLFEKAWFSWQIHLSKPSPDVFEFVLRDGLLDPTETLFIDDTLMHVEASRSLGINGYHLRLDQGEGVVDLFY